MKSGWKRSAAGMTTSSIAARMAASPESPAQRVGAAGDTCCSISCADSSPSGAVYVTKKTEQWEGAWNGEVDGGALPIARASFVQRPRVWKGPRLERNAIIARVLCTHPGVDDTHAVHT